jgi:hypothetical protein
MNPTPPFFFLLLLSRLTLIPTTRVVLNQQHNPSSLDGQRYYIATMPFLCDSYPHQACSLHLVLSTTLLISKLGLLNSQHPGAGGIRISVELGWFTAEFYFCNRCQNHSTQHFSTPVI